MSTKSQLNQASLSQVAAFFSEYEIRTIQVIVAQDIRNETITQVDIAFINKGKDESNDSVVSFKLLDQASDTHEHISSIGVAPEHCLGLTEAGVGLGSDAVSAIVQKLIKSIHDRVAKVHKEQSILSTEPLGKTFLIYNKTAFTVLKDDGNGQLTIEIMDKEGGRKEAMLSANDLLDGLYVGAFSHAE